MINNIRHLRVFLAVADHNSATKAAHICKVSQPAVTHAIAKIEVMAGMPLFLHSSHGLYPTDAGAMLARRVRRALLRLDKATQAISPRLSLIATSSQLRAIIAVRETENFTLAARKLGIAQPTVHRAVSQLELEAGQKLFERTAIGILATRQCQALADAARLCFAELHQGTMELAEMAGKDVGQIVVGAMPLARSFVLPRAIAEFRKTRPFMTVRVDDGPYNDLLAGLRRGEIDFLIGALRDPLPIDDVVQDPLFNDDLVLVVRAGHPLAGQDDLSLAQLANFPWVVARPDTPTRNLFDELFSGLGDQRPKGLVESGSLILMRQLLLLSDHIGCISRLQAAAEIEHGLMVPLRFDLANSSRLIGITKRTDWLPTRTQMSFLAHVTAIATGNATLSGHAPVTFQQEAAPPALRLEAVPGQCDLSTGQGKQDPSAAGNGNASAAG